MCTQLATRWRGSTFGNKASEDEKVIDPYICLQREELKPMISSTPSIAKGDRLQNHGIRLFQTKKRDASHELWKENYGNAYIADKTYTTEEKLSNLFSLNIPTVSRKNHTSKTNHMQWAMEQISWPKQFVENVLERKSLKPKKKKQKMRLAVLISETP